ncbi:hypothetical protein O3X23_43660, partial [Streptomyces sp. H39-S7]|nr:hypothetical protein [Streptomyces sp. H39-S7]
NVRADGVLRAKEAGLPLLMVEVYRATEPVQRVADKVASYAACYRRQVNNPATPGTWTARSRDAGAGSVPYWQTLYPETGLAGWPPLAFVFSGAGPRALHNRIQELAVLTRKHWAADDRRFDDDDGYLDFTDKVPLVVTTLDRLREHGPHGPAWRRVAQERGAEFEPLLTALTDTRTKAAYQQRADKRRAAAEARWKAEQAAQQAKHAQRLQRWQAEEDAERAPVVPQCATPDCEQLVNAEVDWYTEITVPPQDGVYCGPCRHAQAYRNRGLRGALRRMRKPSDQA